jgi:thiamine monophosphate synthase
MKFFAITPDNATIDKLIDWLPKLKSRGVTHLYLRLPAAGRAIHRLIDAATLEGVLPIVPYTIYKHDMLSTCGVHYKSTEISLLAQLLPVKPRLITASCHCSGDARFALQSGAHYAYVSPVYEPLSKHGDMRPLFPGDELHNLVMMHGERIVLLGGMTLQRMQKFSDDFKCDFSIAGITLFFNDFAGL